MNKDCTPHVESSDAVTFATAATAEEENCVVGGSITSSGEYCGYKDAVVFRKCMQEREREEREAKTD